MVFDGTRYVGLAPIIDNSGSETYRLPFRSTQIRPKDVDDTAIQYIALARNRFQKPKISVDTPSDLRSTHNAADYILITHKSFIEDVQPLADFRNQQGMRTKVVDVQNIYDEFNHGILNPNAIREFLSYAYNNWQPPAPTYVFLVGDTHIDLKNQPNFRSDNAGANPRIRCFGKRPPIRYFSRHRQFPRYADWTDASEQSCRCPYLC